MPTTFQAEVRTQNPEKPYLLSGFWVLGSGFWVLGSGFWVLLVGAGGFAPPPPCSQSRCATRLRYTPPPLPHHCAPEPHSSAATRFAEVVPLEPTWTCPGSLAGCEGSKVAQRSA